VGPPIEHVIVLMLENRSFDHLLGFLDHPNPRFDGLRDHPYTNPAQDGSVVRATPTAKTVLPIDPDHSHDAVMREMGLDGAGTGAPTMQGYVAAYADKGAGRSRQRWSGLLAPIVHWRFGRNQPLAPACGPLVMACHAPEHVPTLATLAREFAVCTRWFSPLPGETMPNRAFAHAATSDGDTNTQYRFLHNTTIFEQLEAAGRDWRVYHDDLPALCQFVDLWDRAGRIGNWYGMESFGRHVADNQLAAYSFIEPNHRPIVHIPGSRQPSDSQHPGNNLVDPTAYDTWDDSVAGDFRRAERLVAHVYEALRARPDVFERTILVIAYDEPGGLADHVAPPTTVDPGPSLGGWERTVQHVLLQHRSAPFAFDRLGPRVPAVVVSPFVAAGTLDDTVRDHTTIPATLRSLFAPNLPPLTPRDAAAPAFAGLLSLAEPRRAGDLPDLSAHLDGAANEPAPPLTARAPMLEHDLAVLARRVRRRLKWHGVWAAWWPPLARDQRRIDRATLALTNAARRTRQKLGVRPGD
jgi:phospholipase C